MNENQKHIEDHVKLLQKFVLKQKDQIDNLEYRTKEIEDRIKWLESFTVKKNLDYEKSLNDENKICDCNDNEKCVNEWIKVENETPSRDKPAEFTFCDDEEIHTDIWYDLYDKEWMKDGKQQSYDMYRGKVTHWMPELKPPKN